MMVMYTCADIHYWVVLARFLSLIITCIIIIIIVIVIIIIDIISIVIIIIIVMIFIIIIIFNILWLVDYFSHFTWICSWPTSL